MALPIRLWRIAFWGAWVLAGMVGSVLPVLGPTLGWYGLFYNGQDFWIVNGLGWALVAFPQYIVLRLLISRPSIAGAMWIPVSVVAFLVASLTGNQSAAWIANTLQSVGAFQATPIWFSFLTVIIAVQSITVAAALGLAQGLLLARVFVASSAARLWFGGNLAAAAVVFVVSQIRDNSVSNQINQTLVDQLLPTAMFGGLYAAVTGIALVALPMRNPKGAVPN